MLLEQELERQLGQEQAALQEQAWVPELELEQEQVLAEQLGQEQEQLQVLGLAEQLLGQGQVEQLGLGRGLVMGPWLGQVRGKCH